MWNTGAPGWRAGLARWRGVMQRAGRAAWPAGGRRGVLGRWVGLMMLATPAGALAAELVLLQFAPLTGFDGGTGHHMQRGAELAVAQAQADGLLPGHRLRLLTLDERPGQVAEQLRQAQAQTPGALVAVLGLHGRRGLAELAHSHLLDGLNLPVVGPHTGAVGGPGLDAPWLILTRGSHADEVEAVFRHLTTVARRRLMLATTEDEEGREVSALVAQAAARTGVAVSVAPPHPAGSAQVAAAVEACLQTPHDAVLLASNTSAVANFAKNYVRGGGRGQLIALASAEAAQLSAILGSEAARGVLLSQVVPHPRDPKQGLMREFQAAWRQFGTEGGAPSLVMVEAYIAARVAIDGLRRSPRPDGAALLRTLAAQPSPLILSGTAVVLRRQGQAWRGLSMIGQGGALLY